MTTPATEPIRCRESRRVDADRVCDLFTGLSPWKCPPCARNEPWSDEAPSVPAAGIVWVGPQRFTSLPMLQFHVKQWHGQWIGDVKPLRRAVIEHAAMHGQFPRKDGKLSALDAEFVELLEGSSPAGVTPHFHENVESWSVMRLTQGHG